VCQRTLSVLSEGAPISTAGLPFNSSPTAGIPLWQQTAQENKEKMRVKKKTGRKCKTGLLKEQKEQEEHDEK
jgi:hypothetical protein